MTTETARRILQEIGVENLHVERGNAKGEVVINSYSCWDQEDVLFAAFMSHRGIVPQKGTRTHEYAD